MSYSDYMDSETCRKIISERLARERKPVPKTILNTEYNIDEFLEKEICAKIVNRSKYETKDKSTLLWWNNLFKELEAKHSRPPFKKRVFLEKLFSKTTLKDLENIGIEIHDEEEIVIEPKKWIIDSTRQHELNKMGVSEPLKIDKRETVSCAYLNFIKKSKTEAEIWRPQKTVSIDDLSLLEKAENITENLAEDFDQWFQGMGGQRKTDINKSAILDLFSMVFKYPAATSMCVAVKELGSIPEQVANATHRPKFAESAMIRRQINRDLAAMKQEPITVAFGKTLPRSLRFKPVKEDVREKWLKCNVYHDELASMAAVWEGIEELQSTRSFCKWLHAHPEIPPPPYLQNTGLMEEKKFLEPIHSACQLVSADSEDNLSVHTKVDEELKNIDEIPAIASGVL